MLGKTHVLGGTAAGLACYCVLNKTGLLLPDVNEYLQLGIMLPYAIWSSKVPDLDRADKDKAEESPINLAIQSLFKSLNVKHRGFLSHVAPAVIFTAAAVSFRVMNAQNFKLDQCIMFLIFLGLACGFMSHALLDCFTTQGIDTTISGKGPKLRFVPHNEIFGTGTDYESIWQRCLYVLCCILFGLLIYLTSFA